MDLVPQGGGFFNAAGFENNFEPEVARLPTDLTPCAAEASGVCFACVYGAQMNTNSKAKPVYEELLEIIKSMYGQTSSAILVNIVDRFYREQIQRYFNYPDWSKEMIWQHISVHMQDDHIVTSEAIGTMTAAIEFMRENGICETTENGHGINHKNMRLYMDMVRTRDQLISSRRNRRNV